jgi:hypothetical protein
MEHRSAFPLLGDRQEFRFGEQAGAIVMKAFSFLLLEV